MPSTLQHNDANKCCQRIQYITVVFLKFILTFQERNIKSDQLKEQQMMGN